MASLLVHSAGFSHLFFAPHLETQEVKAPTPTEEH